MKLTTQYLGLTLKNPIMPGASPLVDNLDAVRRMEDAGAAAIVMRSLFEEQILLEERAELAAIDAHEYGSPEAASYLPTAGDFVLGPERYLDQIQKVKSAVSVPVIASLNGISNGGWTRYAKLIEEAGADALEVNVYYLPSDPMLSGAAVEDRVLKITKNVTSSISIPVAVKLSPYFSALPHLAAQLQKSGAKGLVLFNRFFQPDLDPEELEVMPTLKLSDSYELRLRLRWLAILRGADLPLDFAASGGVHTGMDAVKAIMTGATIVQVVSTLLRHGVTTISNIIRTLEQWGNEHGYETIDELRGCLSLSSCPAASAFERANYMKVLQSWENCPEVVKM